MMLIFQGWECFVALFYTYQKVTSLAEYSLRGLTFIASSFVARLTEIGLALIGEDTPHLIAWLFFFKEFPSWILESICSLHFLPICLDSGVLWAGPVGSVCCICCLLYLTFSPVCWKSLHIDSACPFNPSSPIILYYVQLLSISFTEFIQNNQYNGHWNKQYQYDFSLVR